MGHESTRKRRLKSEEIARNVRALINAAWSFVGLWNTLARTEQCQVRWAGPATPIQIQIQVQVLVAQRDAAAGCPRGSGSQRIRSGSWLVFG